MTRRDPAHAAGVTPARMATKLPEIAVVFWLLKSISTGMNEALSDSPTR